MLVMSFRDSEMGTTDAVGSVEVPAIGTQHLVGRGGAQARPTRWIELLNDRLHVGRRLLGRHGAAGGSYGDHFQRRIAKCHAQGHGIVDAGVHVEDYFSSHSILTASEPP